jgi:hypothetical protein
MTKISHNPLPNASRSERVPPSPSVPPYIRRLASILSTNRQEQTTNFRNLEMAGFGRQTKTEAQPVPAHDDDKDNKVEMNNVMRMTAVVVFVSSMQTSVGLGR